MQMQKSIKYMPGEHEHKFFTSVGQSTVEESPDLQHVGYSQIVKIQNFEYAPKAGLYRTRAQSKAVLVILAATPPGSILHTMFRRE